MSDFNDIIQEINTNLPDNTTQSITAKKLRDTLIDLTVCIEDQQDTFASGVTETVTEIGNDVTDIGNTVDAMYAFKGVATTSTHPSLDEKQYWIGAAGTYTYFNNLTVPEGHLGIFMYDTSWTLTTVEVGEDYSSTIAAIEEELDEISASLGSVGELSNIFSEKLVFSKGKYYTGTGTMGNYVDARYIDDFYAIPAGATKIYYTGKTTSGYGGGILFYDANKTLLSNYYSTTDVYDQEVSIVSGAKYIKGCSITKMFNIYFDVNNTIQIEDLVSFKTSIEQLETAVESAFTTTEITNGTIFDNLTVTAYNIAQGGMAQLMFNTKPYKITEMSYYDASADGTELTVMVYTLTDIDTTNRKATLYDYATFTGSVSGNTATITIESGQELLLPVNGAIIATTWKPKYTSVKVNNSYGLLNIVNTNIDAVGVPFTYNSNLNYNLMLSVKANYTAYTPDLSDAALQKALSGNILYGKKYAAAGDSITEANSYYGTIDVGPYAGSYGCYANWIGTRNYMSITNLGKGGATINSWISNNHFESIPATADYITIWFGINDDLGNITVGDPTDSPANQSAAVSGSTCGAFNWLIGWILTNRPQAKLGIVITHSCSANRRNAIIAVSKRWGIPYLDLYAPNVPYFMTREIDGVTMPAEASSTRAWQHLSGAVAQVHPSPDGCKYLSTIVENFLRTL